jgi:putative selenium metabolism protein SsnA
MSANILYNAAIVPFGGNVVVPDGAIAWDSNDVVAMGVSQNIRHRFHDADEIDAGGRMVTPGLINLHSHFYSTLARGLSPIGQPPSSFPEILESLWWRWDKCLDLDAVNLSAQLGLLHSLQRGVTTVFDHHSSPKAVRGSLNAIAEAYIEVGLRGSVCYEVSDRDGSEITQHGIQENLACAEALAKDPNGGLTSHFGLHANFTLSDDTLRRVSSRISGKEIGIHIHMAEDDSDNKVALSAGYTGPVDRLDHFGLLNEKALLIHGVHLSTDQWDIVRERGCHLVHNPASNLNNAVGIAPVGDMLNAGISVGLGTDGYGSHMVASASMAQLAAKIRSGDPRQGSWAVSLLTEANPRIASNMLNRKIGVLEPGAAADFVLWDYIPMTPLDDKTFPAHILFGMPSAKPIDIWIDGAKVFKNGRPIHVDQDQIVQEAKGKVAQLWTRFRESGARGA